MNISSRDDTPDPIIPACLTNPSQYDATIRLEPELYDLYPDEDATEKRAVVREEVSA